VFNSAGAAQYSGKCAKQAESAAITKWADVPNPDANLEYITISSKAVAARSSTYIVDLAFSDGNETARGQYKVTFGDISDCSQAQVTFLK
jgi:hypothetical protein